MNCEQVREALRLFDQVKMSSDAIASAALAMKDGVHIVADVKGTNGYSLLKNCDSRVLTRDENARVRRAICVVMIDIHTARRAAVIRRLNQLGCNTEDAQ